MGSKLEPGAFDAWEKAGEDEPLFVLLARDPLAPAVVEAWGDPPRGRDPSADSGRSHGPNGREPRVREG